MGRKIVVAMINIAVGLFTAYMYIVSERETKISTTQSNIACDIINLDLRSGSRHHPSADIIYQGKKYDTVINKSDSLQLGFNNTLLGYIIGPLDWFTVIKRNIIVHWGYVYYGHQ